MQNRIVSLSGKGHIVKKDWVDACKRQKRRAAERKYYFNAASESDDDQEESADDSISDSDEPKKAR